VNRYGFAPISPITGIRPTPAAPGQADGASPVGRAEPDRPSFWAAVGQIGRELVDVLTDDVDVAEAKRVIAGAVRDWAHDQTAVGEPMPSAQEQAALARVVFDRRYGLGVLQPYLQRNDVENIVVNGHAQTWVTYTDGTKEPGPAVAASDDELIEWVQSLTRRGDAGPCWTWPWLMAYGWPSCTGSPAARIWRCAYMASSTSRSTSSPKVAR